MRTLLRFHAPALLAALLVLLCANPAPAVELPALNLRQLEDLPVQHEGRNKPFFTLARESLIHLHGSEVFKDPETGRKTGPVALAAALWFSPAGWETRPLIQVSLRPLRARWGLDPARRYFSFNELISNQAVIAAVDEARAMQRREERPKLTRLQREASNVGNRLALLSSMLSGSLFAAVPVALPGGGAGGAWVAPNAPGAAGLPAARFWEAMRDAYRSGDQAAFDAALDGFRNSVRQVLGGAYPSEWVIGLEHLYAQLHPFRWAWVSYALAALVLILLARGRAATAGYIAGWVFTLAGLALQIFGFYCRTAISGRPPVSNMYESVIWVGFGVALFGIIFEAIHRCRTFLLAAAPAAMVSLYLADSAPQILDPAIHPLQPVLQDNFWLTTHVLTITLSYAAFLLALALAHIVLARTLAGNRPDEVRPIFNHIYRALQAGVLLLAAGIVLGAFWANYSWGRFWDWDPKETWSLIALLSYLIILHGRIAGWWSGFGMAAGSIFAFLTVLMAWYGVNFVLGAGLHSYGFGTGGLGYVLALVGAELVFLIAAMLRARKPARPAAAGA